MNPKDCKASNLPDEAKLSDFKHGVSQIEVYPNKTCGWRGASRVLRHVRRHQTEVDNSELGELLHTVASSVDRDHPALSFGHWTFIIKATSSTRSSS